MIASASDIRSAIRVYYGEPAPAAAPVIDVPPPPTRLEGQQQPMTTREGRGQRDVPPSAPHTPPVPTTPDRGPPVSSSASRPQSQPPPVPTRASQPPPPPRRPSQPNPEDIVPPPTTRSNPPPGGVEAAAAEHDERAARRAVPKDPDSERGRRRARMLSLTLLDGTQIKLPTQKKKAAEGESTLTARDIISALRATAHGADASEILGEQVKWEPIVAALLSILLRKGLIADWELVEEIRKI
jgi:type IV pilus assembly protein PilB